MMATSSLWQYVMKTQLEEWIGRLHPLTVEASANYDAAVASGDATAATSWANIRSAAEAELAAAVAAFRSRFPSSHLTVGSLVVS